MSLRHLEPPPAAAVADLSFRSLRGAAEHLLSLTTEKVLIALAKPQFETSRLLEDEYDGLIRSPQEAGEILKELIAALRGEGLAVGGIMASPLPGRAGNREFLLLISPHERLLPGFTGEVEEEDVLRAAAEAFTAGE
jgi:23S rRNA (cytidine1920-2'-O)/16S rRNA (cytidine1409-2'-O)-methyltransferase